MVDKHTVDGLWKRNLFIFRKWGKERNLARKQVKKELLNLVKD